MQYGSAASSSLLSAQSRSSSCFGCWGNVRRELSEAGIRGPELTLQVLSGMGGVWGFLIVSGWTLTLIAGVLLAVFP